MTARRPDHHPKGNGLPVAKKKKNKAPAAPPAPALEPGPLGHQPFAALKGVRIEGPAPLPAPEPPPPAAPKPDGDEDAFRAAMADVARPRWKNMRIEAVAPKNDPFIDPGFFSEDQEVLEKLKELVDGHSGFDIVDTDEYLEGHIRGIRPMVVEKLRKGRFSVQAYLDLHGLTLKEAKEEVAVFITQAAALGYRCVLLIHGRGLNSKDQIPVLKKKLDAILLSSPVKRHILAFTTARPVDGGAGASYVLLRAKKK